ncbi:MAG: hypothetical protein ABJA87_02570 [bacterium]
MTRPDGDNAADATATNLADALAFAQHEERADQEADARREADVDGRIAETLSRADPV